MTRVAIGENGMLKVVHLVHLSRALPTFGGVEGIAPPERPGAPQTAPRARAGQAGR